MNSNTDKDRGGFIQYIATRSGTVKNLSKLVQVQPTMKQEKLIQSLLSEYPEIEQMKEYKTFKERKSIASASELIEAVCEEKFDMILKKEDFIKYIAERPGTVKKEGHGLFSMDSEKLILEQVKNKIGNHQGRIWTFVLSLTREDANCLGYEQQNAWKSLLCSNHGKLAEIMKIEPRNFHWYASFHNTSHHPHIHIVMLSDNVKEGYLSKQGIEKMRSLFANDIFKQEMGHVYQQKDYIKKQFRDCLNNYFHSLEVDYPEINKSIFVLGRKLENYQGRLSYGYLPKYLKQDVDDITEKIQMLPEVQNLLKQWNLLINQQYSLYTDKNPEISLIRDKTFRSIKNQIIKEASNYSLRNYTPSNLSPDISDQNFEIKHDDMTIKEFENNKLDFWNENYKKPLELIYSRENVEEGIVLLEQEAKKQNPIASWKLAELLEQGKFIEKDLTQSEYWYKQAVAVFKELQFKSENPYYTYRLGKAYQLGKGVDKNELEAKHLFLTTSDYLYSSFSLGNMFYFGSENIETDYEKAFFHLKNAANKQFPYAEYRIAEMYRRGLGVIRNDILAEQYYSSALSGFIEYDDKQEDGNVEFKIGNILINGLAGTVDKESGINWLKKSIANGCEYGEYLLMNTYLKLQRNEAEVREAMNFFQKRVIANPEKNLLYKLGKIYFSGAVGVQSDLKKAFQYFKQSSQLGNPFASLKAAEICCSSPDYGSSEIYYQKALDQLYLSLKECDDAIISFYIGKLLAEGKGCKQDYEAAIYFLKKSIYSGSEFAEEYLMNLYCVLWRSTEELNQAFNYYYKKKEIDESGFSDFRVGLFYLRGYEGVEINYQKAMEYFKISAEKGNPFAKNILINLQKDQFNPIINLLYKLGNIVKPIEYGKNAIKSDRKIKWRIKQRKIALGQNEKDSQVFD